MPKPGLSARVARAIVLAIGIWFVVANVGLFADFTEVGWDVRAYWDAAIRLRGGEPLYVSYGDTNATELYRYAPWFAQLWVPITFLPQTPVTIGWTATMIACSFLAVWPVLRTRSYAGAVTGLIFWPMLAYVSIAGNVHAAMVCILIYGLGTRWGPLAIASAASLKAVPILLVLVYIGRRDWTRAAITLGLTGLLVTPMLLYDLTEYTTDPGGGVLLTGVAWIVMVAVSSGLAVHFARTRYGWLAAATAVTVAFPRWFVYDASLLLAGFPNANDERQPLHRRELLRASHVPSMQHEAEDDAQGRKPVHDASTEANRGSLVKIACRDGDLSD